jgi:hypothetical protein
MPRLPSIEWIRAVSSPQTNAPAPILMMMSRLEAAAQDVVAEQAVASWPVDRDPQPLDRERVLRPDVDVCLGRADRVGGEGHAFDEAVRVAFDDGAVHERAGVALVGVADRYFCSAGCCSAIFHLRPVGKPPPPRPRRPLSIDRRRRARAGVISRSASASRAYPPRAMYSSMLVGVDQAAVLQHPARLRREERVLVEEGHVRPRLEMPRPELAEHVLLPGISPAKTRVEDLGDLLRLHGLEAHPRTAGQLHVDAAARRSTGRCSRPRRDQRRAASRSRYARIASSVLPAPAPRPHVPAPT